MIAALLMIFGAVGVAGGIFGKDFRNADVITVHEFKGKSSTWSGRLVFILVGVCLMVVGFTMLVRA